MQRLATFTRAACALAAISFALPGWSQSFWGADPFKTLNDVAPAPGTMWTPRHALPPVVPPAVSPPPQTATALTLPELTEFALRNNPRARQAWFAARAAAAGVGVEQADLLPQVSGTFTATRIRPISGTTGTVSPWQTRYGPAVSLSY